MSGVIPLAGAADALLAELASVTGAAAIAGLDGATLLSERASLHGFRVPGLISAGGSCRLYPAEDDWIALNLARPDDRDLLPALFRQDDLDTSRNEAIAAAIRPCDAEHLVGRGRMMGLAMATLRETRRAPQTPAILLAKGCLGQPRPRPHVLDLSALWAGPLATHLFWLAGSEVIKVESGFRPDAMRHGQPDFFALLNQGKASVVLDPREGHDRQTLLGLIAGADIVVEAARPRALAQLGIDADRLVAAQPGLVWLTITGHGAKGQDAGWVGFGDDCGIAGGLGAAMLDQTGRPAFVGDAIADPLAGLLAALAGWSAWQSGEGGRWGISMRDVVAHGLLHERSCDATALSTKLHRWGKDEGQPFPPVRQRPCAKLPDLGADPPVWRSVFSC